MATVMCGSQSRTRRVRVAGIEPVRCVEPVRAREMSAIVSVDARPAEFIDQRAFSKTDATSERVALSHEADNVEVGFSARTRARELASVRAGDARRRDMSEHQEDQCGKAREDNDATANL
jgi:hypothetical protein